MLCHKLRYSSLYDGCPGNLGRLRRDVVFQKTLCPGSDAGLVCFSHFSVNVRFLLTAGVAYAYIGVNSEWRCENAQS